MKNGNSVLNDKRQDISKRLANRLRDTRKSRDLSLDALAKLSGVSRSMLSQIERGESSPTVAILWNLTQALQVDFSGLLDEGNESAGIYEVVRAHNVPVIRSRGEGCQIRILSATTEVGETEIYDIEFEKFSKLESDAHRKGCVEHLTVVSGNLTVTSLDASEKVSAGDTIRYAADVTHCIRSQKQKARALLVVKGA